MTLDWEHHDSLSAPPVARALPWAFWLRSQVYSEIALSRITSFSMGGSGCTEQIAPEKGQITSQGSTRVHKGRVPAGSLWPLFSALLVHETNCLVDALWLLEFRKVAGGTESFLYNPQHKWTLSAKQCVFKENSNVKSVRFLQNGE